MDRIAEAAELWRSLEESESKLDVVEVSHFILEGSFNAGKSTLKKAISKLKSNMKTLEKYLKNVEYFAPNMNDNIEKLNLYEMEVLALIRGEICSNLSAVAFSLGPVISSLETTPIFDLEPPLKTIDEAIMDLRKPFMDLVLEVANHSPKKSIPELILKLKAIISTLKSTISEAEAYVKSSEEYLNVLIEFVNLQKREIVNIDKRLSNMLQEPNQVSILDWVKKILGWVNLVF